MPLRPGKLWGSTIVAIYHKIVKCPKCRGLILCVNGMDYECDVCGPIKRHEAVEILHKKIHQAKRLRRAG